MRLGIVLTGVAVVAVALALWAFYMGKLAELSHELCGSCGGFASLYGMIAFVCLVAALVGGVVALVGSLLKLPTRGLEDVRKPPA